MLQIHQQSNCHYYDDSSSSLLIGCRYYRQWINVNDQFCDIYGTILEYEENQYGCKYKIEYDKVSRNKLNNNSNNNNVKERNFPVLVVPEFEIISYYDAWGGCREYYLSHLLRNPRNNNSNRNRNKDDDRKAPIRTRSKSRTRTTEIATTTIKHDNEEKVPIDENNDEEIIYYCNQLKDPRDRLTMMLFRNNINSDNVVNPPSFISSLQQQQRQQQQVDRQQQRDNNNIQFLTWRIPHTIRRKQEYIRLFGYENKNDADDDKNNYCDNLCGIGKNIKIVAKAENNNATRTMKIPRVTMQYKEYELTFRVKQSTVGSITTTSGVGDISFINNDNKTEEVNDDDDDDNNYAAPAVAGLGVFLSCRIASNNNNHIEEQQITERQQRRPSTTINKNGGLQEYHRKRKKTFKQHHKDHDRYEANNIEEIKIGSLSSSSLLTTVHQPQSHSQPQSKGYLELDIGEMIDIGIYAPYISNDIKSMKEFRNKCDRLTSVATCCNGNDDDDAGMDKKDNFICTVEDYMFFANNNHNHNNDEDNRIVFDITDDETGKLHSVARLHIPPFVNEVTDPNSKNKDANGNEHHKQYNEEEEEQSVYPAFDCQGALHYLLGHMNPVDGKFRILADGSEKELFTDYGIHYEPVRKRKGYSKTNSFN